MFGIEDYAKAPRPVHRARGRVAGRDLGGGVLRVCGQAPHVAETHFLGTTSPRRLKFNRLAGDGWRSRGVEDRSQMIPRRASSRSFEANPSRLSTPKRIEVTAIRISAETATNSMVASTEVLHSRCFPVPGSGDALATASRPRYGSLARDGR